MIKKYENSYVTPEEAETYFATRLENSAWNAATDDIKERALITASRKLENLNFLGVKAVCSQPMAFPRLFGSWEGIPEAVEQAVFEEAIALLEQGDSVHTKNRELGIQSVSLGSASVAYKDVKQEGLLSPEAYILVSKWLRKGFDIKNPEIYGG